ncbi:hypothetical protein DICPUDRAFT_95045 [Dictyostelium purpureum]|uniref:GATA-type domain-containing protein n=1 Tax=Dictyostelium purpureum TaxID=5786 RepID=F0ZRL9_DICPU|nr:uncharacterized protein DICPUDRAFT_95045 [Dictyostelium purpureum]EGC33405.1 hypothetical protein DICPUDRAFT_95045 [Dictyostelium purpureum]|eukprot:XP_003290069.1 hypothetical protein DICPUDRAFT_95045 [Dictyostelium purpureum]
MKSSKNVSNTKNQKQLKVNKGKSSYTPIDSSQKKKAGRPPVTEPKICLRCKTDNSCGWRRGPGYCYLCNSCGLQYKKILKVLAPYKVDYQYAMYSHIAPLIKDVYMLRIYTSVEHIADLIKRLFKCSRASSDQFVIKLGSYYVEWNGPKYQFFDQVLTPQIIQNFENLETKNLYYFKPKK